MSDTPKPEIIVGQRWGLWVFDDAIYTKLTITKIKRGIAHGMTEEGQPCAVGLERLRQRGELLDSIQIVKRGNRVFAFCDLCEWWMAASTGPQAEKRVERYIEDHRQHPTHVAKTVPALNS